MPRAAASYSQIIEHIFFKHYKESSKSFDFDREEIVEAANALGVNVPANLGDVIYSYRYRASMPERMAATCVEGEEWILPGIGPGEYRFRKVPITKIEPRAGMFQTKVPNATPEIVAKYALGDEQAVLARVRYNRLIDVFTGIVAYSLQNHLRTQVHGVQMEIDELYVGVSKDGAQFILPVQAKGGRDRVGRIQLEQDVEYCKERFPELICRPIAAYLMADDAIAMFELMIDDEQVRIRDERQYRLVPASEISAEDLARMRGEGPPNTPRAAAARPSRRRRG